MNINAMMAQAKKMQAEMDKAKKALAKEEFVVNKQGISVTMMGDGKLTKVDINEILIDPDDKETLEDMIIIAVNEAYQKVAEAEAKLQPQSSGMPF